VVGSADGDPFAPALGYPAPVAIIDLVSSVDRSLAEAVEALRSGPLTAVMTLLSAWWVKSLVIAGIGTVADLRRRPLRLPPTPFLAGAALLAASLLSDQLKELAGRVRPSLADHGLSALVAVPGDASFPSGHATSAFAAAGVVAALHPRLRVPVLALAALVALSRVYLGVHYPSDVIVGAALGLAIAAVVVALGRRIGAAPLRRPVARAPLGVRIRPWRSSAPT
jgi:undecaprenyl-diphosphatase